jgi:hypothetical protein
MECLRRADDEVALGKYRNFILVKMKMKMKNQHNPLIHKYRYVIRLYRTEFQ